MSEMKSEVKFEMDLRVEYSPGVTVSYKIGGAKLSVGNPKEIPHYVGQKVGEALQAASGYAPLLAEAQQQIKQLEAQLSAALGPKQDAKSPKGGKE